jgi:hypothetical protein
MDGERFLLVSIRTRFRMVSSEIRGLILAHIERHDPLTQAAQSLIEDQA